MGITIPKDGLRNVLEEAVILAESNVALPGEWLRRTGRIGESPSQSYVAALGTALLAKAADDRVDVLAVKASAGPRAYSMRSVVAVLVERAAHYGYHLGVTGPEPLNNQPWFGLDRVDEPVKLRAAARPFHRDMIRFLTDLNGLSSTQAVPALAAFLRLRLEHARTLKRERDALAAAGPVQIGTLIGLLEHFITDDPEGGRRGQALVAALLDLMHDEVHLAAINDPTGLDVRVLRDGRVIVGVEVKQKAVDEATARHLAEEAARAGADKALLVAIATGQRPLDQDAIRRTTQDGEGVLTIAYDSVGQLVSQVVLHAPMPAAEAAQRLPALYLKRMQEHQVSPEGQRHWTDLCAQLTPPP